MDLCPAPVTLKSPCRVVLTGKRFRLTRDTLGIEGSHENRAAVSVPAGEVVLILSGPRLYDQRLVDVLWGKRPLVMFAEDIERGGEEVGPDEAM